MDLRTGRAEAYVIGNGGSVAVGRGALVWRVVGGGFWRGRAESGGQRGAGSVTCGSRVRSWTAPGSFGGERAAGLYGGALSKDSSRLPPGVFESLLSSILPTLPGGSPHRGVCCDGGRKSPMLPRPRAATRPPQSPMSTEPLFAFHRVSCAPPRAPVRARRFARRRSRARLSLADPPRKPTGHAILGERRRRSPRSRHLPVPRTRPLATKE